jgi:hypothetical protein
MSIFNDSILKNVAGAAAKIMAEKLHPNQQKLDVHEPEKDKLTAQDFKKLRSMKKEETEAVKEAAESPFTSYKKPRPIESKGGAGIKKGTAYGGSAQKSKPEQETAEEKPMKKKKLSEMVAMYNEKGLKSLSKMAKPIKEEPDNEQFTKEVEDQKDSMTGKKKQPSVAAPATQGVKVMPEDYEVIDADEINGVKIDNIQERSLSEPEMKKKEEIVKGMKKGLQGFKDRYGKDAKSVMYATATKQAMKESAESEHYEAGHKHGADHALDSGFKVTARARKKEMLSDNPHSKGSQEHKDWHRGALDGHETALDNM